MICSRSRDLVRDRLRVRVGRFVHDVACQHEAVAAPSAAGASESATPSDEASEILKGRSLGTEEALRDFAAFPVSGP